MNASKHLLDATEMTTCRSEVETYHVKMLNGLIAYSGQIFKHNPLFFIIQNCVNHSQCFILRSYLALILLCWIKV